MLVLLLALTQLLALATTEHVVYNGRTLEGGERVCPGDQQTRAVLDEIDMEVRNIILVGLQPYNPANSCSAISEILPSGLYWVRSHNGTAVQVFCDMDRVCGCSNTRGWTRVANLNMRDPSQQCPGEWILQNRSSQPRRLCGRNLSINSGPGGCLSATYSTYSISYSHVCGRVIGYQYGLPDAFGDGVGLNVEGTYLDGVSLTHGLPGTRQHIWSFSAGLTEIGYPGYPMNSCPCLDTAVAPSFVGNDYFCESAIPTPRYVYILHASDPLWDGQGCGSPPCCELSTPPGVTAPWFCKQLPQTTTDDIEVRICGNQPPGDEDTPVEHIEIYIR